MDDNTRIHAERIRVAFQQIPGAVIVTLVNAGLIAAVLMAVVPDWRLTAWLGVTALVAAGRLLLWRAHRDTASPDRSWSLVSMGGAGAAGLLWGGGSVMLLPDAETYQMLWVFLIGGMCAGAATLHYAHLPTALAFIGPAGLPLAIRFALEGSARRAAAAAMIVVFLAVLSVTARRSSRYFGDTLRLRLDLEATRVRLLTETEEHRVTEASLRQAQKMEAVGQLTGGIAHDFNNLLSVVLGSLELLRNRLPPNDPRAAELLGNALQGAERGAALTHRLLAFGRRQLLRPAVVDLPALVRGMTALLTSSAGAGVRIAMRFPAGLPPVVVDANQLELALLNLVVNARDAMPDGGEVTIGAHGAQAGGPDGLAPGAYVVLTVTDSGTGMDQATLDRAVEPFFTTKDVGKGTGLGLSMVHGLAAQSGGQFRLRSAPGTGTTAELWLPRVARRVAPTAGLPPDQPGRARTVLVVDDEPPRLADTAAMLEALGYRVMEAESGAEALALLQAGARVDCVITEDAMPGMTGGALVDALQRCRPGLPVLRTTARGNPPEAGAADIPRLVTPLGRGALARALERHFDRV